MILNDYSYGLGISNYDGTPIKNIVSKCISVAEK